MNIRFPTTAIVISIATLLVSNSATSTHAAPPHPVAYCIEMQVVHNPNDHQTKVLSNPKVITLDRQQASIQIAEVEQVVIEGDEAITIESGINCRLTPYRLKDGSVKLDVEADVVLPSEGMPDVGVDIVTKRLGVHRVQKVPLDKPIQIPITPRGEFPGYHLSLTISEVPHPQRVEDGRRVKGELMDVDVEEVFSFFNGYER